MIRLPIKRPGRLVWSRAECEKTSYRALDMVQYSRVKGTSVNILRAGTRIPLREETMST